MSKNNKVLTVSYGVFSCKLEGFDDTLEAMKTVTTYFRDLAAEDRRFGAEPKQQDGHIALRRPIFAGVRPDLSRDDADEARTEERPDRIETTAAFSGETATEAEKSGIPDFESAWKRLRDGGEGSTEPVDTDSVTERLHRLQLAAARQDAAALDQRYEEDLEEPGQRHGFVDLENIPTQPASADDRTQALRDAVTEISEALGADDTGEPLALLPDKNKHLSATNPYHVQTRRVPQTTAPPHLMEHPDPADLNPDAHKKVALRDDPAETPAVPPDSAVARKSLSSLDGARDKDLPRLMAEAEHQMQEPEAKTRRSAFAHLRAAVATRFADRSIEDSRATVEKKAVDSFRSDLADAVKPARVKPSATRSDTRVAPLKLVAEQRVGARPTAEAPRRTSSLKGGTPPDDAGFDVYARKRGASGLPDRLEAAAAYLAFVKGYRDFSRPQLMSCLQTGEAAVFDREAELKAFGQLLINDKIRRVASGRFAASDSIGYKPGHRATG